MSNLFTAALAAEHVVLSVLGPHAGENVNTIFARKTSDIIACGKTFWLYKSPAAKPCHVRLCSHAIFLAPSSRNGARPATVSNRAIEFSTGSANWQPLPTSISAVTGKLPAFALVLSALEQRADEMVLDLWRYTVGIEPVRFQLGKSTVVARRFPLLSEHPRRMQSRFRQIIAVASLTEPRAVVLR